MLEKRSNVLIAQLSSVVSSDLPIGWPVGGVMTPMKSIRVQSLKSIDYTSPIELAYCLTSQYTSPATACRLVDDH